MKTLREIVFPLLGIAFALLATGCADKDELLRTDSVPSITHDQCVQFVKWRVLDGSIAEWQSSINSVSAVEVDGYEYRMTDECRAVVSGYQTMETTRNR